MPRSPPALAHIESCRISVVGDVMLDRYWHGDVARISPEAPVPVVRIQREEYRLGGAANVALNIRSLGARVTVLSLVGIDKAARNLRELLVAKEIDDELSGVASMETGVKLRVIGRNQQMLRIDFEKEPDHDAVACMTERFCAIFDKYDLIVFSDYGKGILSHISKMIWMAREAGKPVLVDPKGNDWNRYRGANVITPNRNELAQVIGSWSSEVELRTKAEDLRQQLALQALLVTRSDEGMTLFEADRVSSLTSQAHEVTDVTGAGDTVIATLAVMIACGVDLVAAMGWANLAAGLVVARFGTAVVTYEELSQ